ncbi:MAG: FAD-dependent oxidoreductase, partial [Vicinamibacterales bacterium]
MIVVLGAGPAGLAAAYKLATERRVPVTVIERQARVGGNAASFVVDGIPVDFGSHRLHPATPPGVMADIRRLVGDDLLDRPRHGRIRLRGRWVHFPLKAVDLVLHLPPSFVAGVLGDMIRKPFTGGAVEPSFGSILERGLGRTICRDFYFPYAEKIWGLRPEALDPEQARRRVGNSSLGKMIRKVASSVPGLKKPGAGRFFYPKQGFGQICDAYARAAASAGATLLLNTTVTAVEASGGHVRHVRVHGDGDTRVLPATHVFSTIPLPLLATLVQDGRPQPLAAAAVLPQRAMVLV